MLNHALDYASSGLYVIPLNEPVNGGCSCGNPDCKSIGKHPRTPNGLKDASNDPAIIRKWWTRWPNANIGIVTGAESGIVVVDEDERHAGNESLAALEQEHGPLPPTAKQQTGAGFHFVFKHPGGKIGNRSGVRPGIDIRADNGYIVAAPSRHANGNTYQWIVPPDNLAEMPNWLLTLINPPKPAAMPTATQPPGNLYDALAAMRKIKMVDANDGSRRLLTYCCRAVEHNLSDDDAIHAIRIMHSEQPFPKAWSDDEIRRRLRDAEKTEDRGSVFNGPDLWQAEGRTDAANAQRFVRRYGANSRWCNPTRTWYRWTGKNWGEDQSCGIEADAKQFSRELWREAGKITADPDASDQLKKQVIAFVKASNSANGIRNMIALAKSEPGMTILPCQFDTDAYMLNCNNGTLNLKTGKLQRHRREDLLTKIVAVDYNASEQCPLFVAFLEGVFGGSKNLIKFIQRLLGYILTGDVSEQALMIFHGAGSNGKSTLLTLLLALLAEYGCKAPEKLLTAKKHDSHPTELAKLFGKRLVVANEVDDGAELSEARLKDLTGGDRLTARRMNEDFWDFDPSHKIILASNYKPTVRGGHAIWRRLRLVPFNQKYWSRSKGETGPAELEADSQLAEKLKIEYPGILAWLVAGCLAWQRDGLGVPPEVNEATENYRKSEDSLTAFIDACCEMMPNATANVSAVAESYREFSGDNITSSKLTKLLTGRGFIKEKSSDKETKGQWFWRGFSLSA
ncbi:MAG TPA: phage/plasmid primase, P4 family [Pirellulales bacterium]|jgi:putative DNA primase/helicase|nr:phage/plasmid primase, P4 family [Pirellulales bacterium]